MQASSHDVTSLLERYSRGDHEALRDLIPLVYQELRRLASAYLRRERSDHTLQATALVHEAYLKLVDQRQAHWANRAQFFGVASQLMRRILVDHARKRGAVKRGKTFAKLSLEEAAASYQERPEDLLAIDELLHNLSSLAPEEARVVELRFFGGLSIDEVAATMGLSPATVSRSWTFAKAWLLRELGKRQSELRRQ